MDLKTKSYKETYFLVSMTGQILPYLFIIVLIISLFQNNYIDFLNTWAVFLFMYGLYSSFMIVDNLIDYYTEYKLK